MALIYGSGVPYYGVDPGYRSDPQFNPSRTALAGVPIETLRLWLTSAQNAYMQLMSGAQMVQSVGYEGKTVTYVTTDAARLESFIMLLQRQLGLSSGRRALRPYFR